MQIIAEIKFGDSLIVWDRLNRICFSLFKVNTNLMYLKKMFGSIKARNL